MALSAALISIFLMGPFIDVLIWRDGLALAGRLWRADRGFAGHHGAGRRHHDQAFQVIGPRRTRLVAQMPPPSSAAFSSSGCRSRRCFPAAPCRACRSCSRRPCWRMCRARTASSGGRRAPRWRLAQSSLGTGHKSLDISGPSPPAMRRVSPVYVLAASSASQITRPTMGGTMFRVVTPGAASAARNTS